MANLSNFVLNDLDIAGNYFQFSFIKQKYRCCKLLVLRKNALDVLVSVKFPPLEVTYMWPWSFSTRSTLTDLDVLPRVYSFLRGGNFTFLGRNKQVHCQLAVACKDFDPCPLCNEIKNSFQAKITEFHLHQVISIHILQPLQTMTHYSHILRNC